MSGAPPGGAAARPHRPDLAALSAVVLADETLESVLKLVLELALATVGPADAASAAAAARSSWTVVTSTGVAEIERAQRTSGRGPGIEAVATRRRQNVDVNLAGGQWPEVSETATRSGYRCLLALPLVAAGQAAGVLTLYSRAASAFGAAEVDAAEQLVARAGITVANATALASVELASSNLRRGLATRGIIGQAQGILMARHRCTGDQALARLRRRSQDSNRKVRDVAAEVVAEHERSLS